MATEIERKFLVTGTDWKSGVRTAIAQGYLNRDKERTVRVRMSADQAFLTIKGLSHGASRLEFEYGIPVADAVELMKLCEGPTIQKDRYVVEFAGNRWEVDEFHGDNEGLVVAEIELRDESQAFERPSWVAVEVTDDSRYFNSSLSVTPFTKWINNADLP